MKKFIAGMMFAHYLSLIGRTDFVRAVVFSVAKNVKKFEEETRPSASKDRVFAAEKSAKDRAAMQKRVIDAHDKGATIGEITMMTGFPESTVRNIIEKHEGA